jgi:hypothetical protein
MLTAVRRLCRGYPFDFEDTDMRGTLGLFLVAAVAAACSPGNRNTGPNPDPDPDPDPVIRVAGVYETAVTLVSSDCPGQTVERHITLVSHVPGATALSLTHAGSTYDGSLSADGAFSTTPVTQQFDGISFVISIAGQFTETTMDALVQVQAGSQPPCAFTARWAGPKLADTNDIP